MNDLTPLRDEDSSVAERRFLSFVVFLILAVVVGVKTFIWLFDWIGPWFIPVWQD